MHVEIKITGPAGCGKTRLAMELLRDVSRYLKSGDTAYCESSNNPPSFEREWNIGERPDVGA